MKLATILAIAALLGGCCLGKTRSQINASAHNIDQALLAVERGNVNDPFQPIRAARIEAQAIAAATQDEPISNPIVPPAAD